MAYLVHNFSKSLTFFFVMELAISAEKLEHFQLTHLTRGWISMPLIHSNVRAVFLYMDLGMSILQTWFWVPFWEKAQQKRFKKDIHELDKAHIDSSSSRGCKHQEMMPGKPWHGILQGLGFKDACIILV